MSVDPAYSVGIGFLWESHVHPPRNETTLGGVKLGLDSRYGEAAKSLVKSAPSIHPIASAAVLRYIASCCASVARAC